MKDSLKPYIITLDDGKKVRTTLAGVPAFKRLFHNKITSIEPLNPEVGESKKEPAEGSESTEEADLSPVEELAKQLDADHKRSALLQMGKDEGADFQQNDKKIVIARAIAEKRLQK